MGLALKKDVKYSYSDYLKWGEDERWEIIDGAPYNMSPAPNRLHQVIVGNVFREFSNYLKGKKCKTFIAPFDVRLDALNKDDFEIYNIVQPDVSIFCDEKKLDDKGAIGTPDLVVEVLSPSTMDKDLFQKLLLYQRHGVKEYWVIDPAKKTINISTMKSDGLFFLEMEDVKEGDISPVLFPDLKISVADIFSE